jgi:hypothetical protein
MQLRSGAHSQGIVKRRLSGSYSGTCQVATIPEQRVAVLEWKLRPKDRPVSWHWHFHGRLLDPSRPQTSPFCNSPQHWLREATRCIASRGQSAARIGIAHTGGLGSKACTYLDLDDFAMNPVLVDIDSKDSPYSGCLVPDHGSSRC